MMWPLPLSVPHTSWGCLNPSDHPATARNNLLYLASLMHWSKKLPLFVSKIVFVSQILSLPFPFFCDWICFLCDGVRASHYSPAGQLGNLYFHFPTAHWSVLRLALTGNDTCQGENPSNKPRCCQELKPRAPWVQDTFSDLLWNLSCYTIAAAGAGVLWLERLNWAWEWWNHTGNDGITLLNAASPCPACPQHCKQATACLELIGTAHIQIATGSKNFLVQEFSTSPLNKSLECYKYQSTPVLSWWMGISTKPGNMRLIGGYWQKEKRNKRKIKK